MNLDTRTKWSSLKCAPNNINTMLFAILVLFGRIRFRCFLVEYFLFLINCDEKCFRVNTKNTVDVERFSFESDQSENTRDSLNRFVKDEFSEKEWNKRNGNLHLD